MVDAQSAPRSKARFNIGDKLRNIPALSLLIAFGAVVLDQLSKRWALSHLSDGHIDHVIWTLQWNLSFNSGMAFGRAQGWGPVIAVAATVIIVGFVLTLRRTDSKLAM
ncbi:MAG: signal peptidase, partial [Actinomycetota bacterium]